MKKASLSQKAFEQNANEYVDRAVASAMELLPHVFSLVDPKSVVDVGCGGGAWLSTCYSLGVQDILGIDGDYVDVNKLKIPKQKFQAHDLTKPLIIGRGFDMAISLEVAEHIPQDSAQIFVGSLVRLAPVVLFSAAIPFQGGVGHVNEQWPTYWDGLFRCHGYQVVDCIRRKVWSNNKIDTWYKQNAMLFVDTEYLSSHEALMREANAGEQLPLDVVHPERYLGDADPKNIDYRKIPLNTAWAALMLQTRRMLHSSLHWRLQRLFGV